MNPDGGAIDWESSYLEGDWPWDLGEPAPPLLAMLRDRPREIWGSGAILVPGCGLGHDAHALAAAGHEVIGVDLSPTAVQMAVDQYGETPGLTFMTGDFLDPGFTARRPVSAIFEHTCFCAVPPDRRDDYVRGAARCLPPGARLVALFFIDPRAREDGDDGPPFRASHDEIRSRFAPFFSLERTTIPRNSAAPRDGREWAVELVRNP